jgi:hypothetical protein
LIGAGPVDGPSHLNTAEMLAPRAILLRRCGGGYGHTENFWREDTRSFA